MEKKGGRTTIQSLSFVKSTKNMSPNMFNPSQSHLANKKPWSTHFFIESGTKHHDSSRRNVPSPDTMMLSKH